MASWGGNTGLTTSNGGLFTWGAGEVHAAKAKTAMSRDFAGTLHRNCAAIFIPYVGLASPLVHESLLTRDHQRLMKGLSG